MLGSTKLQEIMTAKSMLFKRQCTMKKITWALLFLKLFLFPCLLCSKRLICSSHILSSTSKIMWNVRGPHLARGPQFAHPWLTWPKEHFKYWWYVDLLIHLSFLECRFIWKFYLLWVCVIIQCNFYGVIRAIKILLNNFLCITLNNKADIQTVVPWLIFK